MTQPGQPAPTARSEPLVSVVIATHNRPAALRQALRSVLHQSLPDWEIIVVGDACRSDTAATVAAFDDERISYIDLPVNFGEQSGPNNIGFARARGRFVAILNHDDVWFPDHLAATTGWADATGADVVIARGVVIRADSHAGGKEAGSTVFGAGKDGRYDPVTTAGFGSAQVVRRASLERLGGWRPASQCFCESSQDWLFRAWRKGATIATMPHLTVLKLHSGERRGSYVQDDAQEQKDLLDAMEAPDALRVKILRGAAEPDQLSSLTYFRRRFLATLGIHPRARTFRRGYTRGGFLAMLREIRGLPPMPAREPKPKDMLARYRADNEKE